MSKEIEYNEAYKKAILGLMLHGCQHLTIGDAKGIMIAIKGEKVPNVSFDGKLTEDIAGDLQEKLRLADMLIDKIDDKKYKQMIATYRALTKEN